MSDPDAEFPSDAFEALVAIGCLAPDAQFTAVPLAGGVSSAIWRIDLDRRSICIKRALARLRVAQEWYAPIERNAHEVAWFEEVAAILPDAVPSIIGHDPTAGIFAMEYLSPAEHPVWKSLLQDGIADTGTAATVADRLARIHVATAGSERIASLFATDDCFFALRCEPFLLATALLHDDVGDRLRELADSTMRSRKVLVHGDVSPKNILVGPAGPVFLDAETAWFGDPAFDLAFCLNHLLLKCMWNEAGRADYLRCYAAFSETYLAGVDWESRRDLEIRASALLPGLMLARIDGKSPVEYITQAASKALVRDFARRFLLEPATMLGQIGDAWGRAVEQS